MHKFLILLFFLMLIPFFMYAEEHEEEGDNMDTMLLKASLVAKEYGYTKISRQDLSTGFKKFFPHDNYFFTDEGYYYKNEITTNRASLIISPLYCGLNNTILINCSNKDYSVLLELDHDLFWTQYTPMYYGLFLDINSYNTIEKLIPNLTQRLNKESILVIPVEIDIYDVYTNIFGGVFSLKKLRILDKKEIQTEINDYSFTMPELEYDIFKIVSNINSISLPGYLPIYTRSKDSYVNMRKEPNSNSEVVAQILTFFPLDDKYIRDIGFEYEKNRTETSCKYQHKGKDKEIASLTMASNYFDYTVDRYATLFTNHTYTKEWYNKVSDFVKKNRQVKSIKLLAQVADRTFPEYDTEKIYLFTEGLPVNGWYKVFYIATDDVVSKKDNRVYGYIHKSQLSWGY